VWLAIVLGSAVLLAAPAGASAATLSAQSSGGDTYTPSGGTITYTAGAGEVNDVTAERVDGGIRVRDAGAAIQPQGDCRADGPAVFCPLLSVTTTAWIQLGDGDDKLDWRVTYAGVRGGPGADRLNVWGEVDGEAGADVMDAQTVAYDGRTAGVQVTLDGVANDGEPGEGDDVRSTAGFIRGGEGADQLTAGPAHAAAVSLTGNGGADRLLGGSAADFLVGGPGDDRLDGSAGDDRLDGGAGGDEVRGGDGRDEVSYAQRTGGVTVTLDSVPDDGEPGERDDIASVEDIWGSTYADLLVGDDAPNTIQGSSGRDTILGGGGNDAIEAADPERVAGGPGADRVRVGRVGRLELRDGETDDAACGFFGADLLDADPFDQALGCSFARLRFVPVSHVRTARDGRVRLSSECVASPGRTCDGAVRLLDMRSRRVLASGPFHLGRGESGSIRLKLRSAGRSTQRRRRSVTVEAVALHQVPSDETIVSGYDRMTTTWITRPKR
jgi:Ca2+-binding RTX toxin-like protein